MLVGGGSGGHVYPLIAVANILKERGDIELIFLGDYKFMGKEAKENGFIFRSIVSGKLRRYFSLQNFLDIFKFFIGLIQSLWYLFWFMPDIILTKGGYISVPPALVAKLYFIPLFIHESDIEPGLANRFLARLANKIFISFPGSAVYFNKQKTVLTGNPIRLEVLQGDKNEAAEMFNLAVNKKTIFVYGGSQGSKIINDIILESLIIMVNKDWQIIHQCGEDNLISLKTEIERLIKEGEGVYADNINNNYRFYPFLEIKQLANAYALSDIFVSRAGAGSITEIAALGKPAILIPLSRKSSRGEQILNAIEFSKYGAISIEEENLTSHILINQIEHILESERYSELSQKIKSFYIPDAANKIAEELLLSIK